MKLLIFRAYWSGGLVSVFNHFSTGERKQKATEGTASLYLLGFQLLAQNCCLHEWCHLLANVQTGRTTTGPPGIDFKHLTSKVIGIHQLSQRCVKTWLDQGTLWPIIGWIWEHCFESLWRFPRAMRVWALDLALSASTCNNSFKSYCQILNITSSFSNDSKLWEGKSRLLLLNNNYVPFKF